MTPQTTNFMSNKQQIRTKSKDQDTEIKAFLGTLIVLLSGLILYADKVVNYYGIQVDYEFRYYSDLDAFLWSLLLGSTLKNGRTVPPCPLIRYN